ncbi:hypothetical protein A2W57_01825 [Candidatus Giovannonibacteria bacterium RIFCSPHIGHO2_02_43_16]|uniref:Histidine kinase/HSP90-like ATPase domain-containing protein n=1 Tax=Candidatus Giovannonibacteria bacterium RIFCSPHIGHO2_02_43_16 TaxID=1798331 RepID=A0A1F5WET9_9BACT|nr:MAG: hypothetical protein A2W57_01825 [Candidatus Giovannonibacteria bacterium RIFCSPHIGHO2_02_43_16]
MDLKKIILSKLKKRKEIRAADIIKRTGFSRAYVDRFFKILQEEGEIALVGKANRARYVYSGKQFLLRAKKGIRNTRIILSNKNLSEDIILEQIKRDTGIFIDIRKNVAEIADYAFLEMLNNAIEHSRSRKIEVSLNRNSRLMKFEIFDAGIGIFRNVMRKRRLKSELEAIQDLIKGKQTTMPRAHSGEGIFFTSKAVDTLIFQSSNKKLIFNNIIGDIFVQDTKRIKGTKVIFTIGLKSKRDLAKIFREFSDRSFEFNKTNVTVKLFKMDTEYISRFRVWKSHHKSASVEYKNADENITFMIKRAQR